MKTRKLLVLGLLLLMTLVFATGCGVEDPTKKDVEKVLKKIGAIPEDDKDSDKKAEYSIEIDKVKLNDDKDRATVECTLNLETEEATVAQQYKMTFRLNDDKEWKIRNSKLEDDVELVSEKLATEISDKAFQELLGEWYSIEVGEVYFKVEEIADQLKITKHELSEDELKDTVTLEGKATYGIGDYQFTVTVVCEYFDRLGKWSVSSYKVADDYKVTYSIDGISKEELLDALEDGYSRDYIDSTRIDSDKLENVEILSHEADLENLKDVVKIHCSSTVNAVCFTFDADITCKYSTSREEWDIEDFTIDEASVKKEYPEDYSIKFTAEDFNRIMHESDDATVTALGNTYYMKTEDVQVIAVSFEPFELEGGTYFSLPVLMTVMTPDMEIDVDVEITLEYFKDVGWCFRTWSGKVCGVQNVMTGTWTGTAAEAGEITVVVERSFDEDGNYIAQITESATGKQYRCALYKLDVSTGEVTTNGTEGSINLKGVISGNTWTLEQDSVVLQKK